MSLRLRRRLLMSNIPKLVINLPSEYQQVSYIESTGTQFINTGIIPNINTSLNAKAQFTVMYSSDIYYSGISAGTGRFGFGYANAVSPNNFAFSIGGKNLNSYINFDTNKHIFGMRGDGFRRVDGVAGINTVTTFDGVHQILIFACRSASEIKYFCHMKLFEYKLYDGDILVRNFIPCYRKSDGVIGLYDTVENKFYINKGTGEFLKGEDL